MSLTLHQKRHAQARLLNSNPFKRGDIVMLVRPDRRNYQSDLPCRMDWSDYRSWNNRTVLDNRLRDGPNFTPGLLGIVVNADSWWGPNVPHHVHLSEDTPTLRINWGYGMVTWTFREQVEILGHGIPISQRWAPL